IVQGNLLLNLVRGERLLVGERAFRSVTRGGRQGPEPHPLRQRRACRSCPPVPPARRRAGCHPRGWPARGLSGGGGLTQAFSGRPLGSGFDKEGDAIQGGVKVWGPAS